MAYAAVISLKHTIERLDNIINIRQITASAYEELNSLKYELGGLNATSSRNIDRSEINELDARIRDAVWKLEDFLESYQPSQGVDQKGVEQEIDSFMKTSKKLKEEYNRVLETPLPAEEDDYAAAPPPPIHEHESTTVGLSDLSQEIIGELLAGKSDRAVTLFGMAGIGKTHLARQIYQHPLIVRHFDLRVWVSVGPKHQDTCNVYADIIAQIKRKPKYLFKGKEWNVLGDLLRKSTRGRRYLIVLDDVWEEVLFSYCKDELTNIDRNGSRFLLTTRLQKVAQYYGETQIYHMPFLSKEESWNLLCQNVFAEDSFSSELEKAGRKIAEKCEGLPLLILTVANILRGLDKTEEYWEMVAEKKTTTFTDAYDQIYEVLLPSYEYLPQYLKPCFLYMGVFPQSSEIPLSKLIDLWTVEDFLEPSRYGTMETFPMHCMEELVSNSLAIVCKRSFERVRRIKFCKLHSAYWYLCVKEARKNSFFHVLIKLSDVVSMEKPRRLSVQNNILFGIKEVYQYDSMAAATSTARSLLYTGEDHQYPVRTCLNMMLLIRVLDALSIRFYEFPNDVLKLLKLRYLTLTYNGELPSSISKLQQLEWLILRRHHDIKFPTTCLPEEIWDLQELRHLRITGSNLPDPSKGTMLWRLLTLYVNADSCSEDVFRSIPNVKKLGIKIELHPDAVVAAAETLGWLEHIGVLNKLESLKCVVVNPRLMSELVVDDLSNLPVSLKKLSLKGLGYPWKYMSAVGSLPDLKVLKLRCSAFRGREWVTKGGQFQRLEFLLLEDIDVVHWINHKSFRCLHHLIVRHCYKLKKIPWHIGGIETLETMEVDECSPSVVNSAQQIKENTKSDDLQLVINSSWKL